MSMQIHNYARHQVPSTIPGLTGHWDYSEASTLTVDGSNLVSQILDKSGNGHTAIAAGGAESTLVDFQGRKGGQVPSANNDIEFFISGSITVRTLIMVMTHPGASGDAFNSPFGSSTDDGVYDLPNSFPKWDGSNGWSPTKNSSVWLNGVPNGDIPGGGIPFVSIHERDVNNTLSTWKLHNNSSLGSWAGIIGEWIVYDRVLTSDERFRIEEYLMQKWNMPRILPVNTANVTRTNNEYFSVADNDSFDYSNGFTASCWFYAESSVTSTTRTIISQWGGAGTRAFTVRINSSDKLIFLGTFNGSSSSGSNGFNIGNNVITLDQWYHVAASYDGDIARLYINGVQVDTTLTTNTIFNPTSPFQIGAQGGGNKFQGGVAFPKFYSRALAGSEVTKLWNRGRPQCDSDLHNDLLQDLVSSWTLVKPFSPIDIAVSCWYDASDISTITDTAGSVSDWNDKSGNSYNLSEATNQPITNSETISGLNAILFDGVNDIMSTSTSPFSTAVAVASVICVIKPKSTTSNGVLFTLNNNDSTTSRWQAESPSSGNQIVFDAGNSTTGRLTSDGGELAVDTPVLLSFTSDIINDIQRIWVNGTIVASDDDAFLTTIVGTTIKIGGNGTFFQNTAIGEFIVINGNLATADRQQIEGYLAHKWGLDASLANWHPYRYAPPNCTLLPTEDQIGTNDFTETNGPIPYTQDKLQKDVRQITKIDPVGDEASLKPTVNITLTWTDTDITKDFLKSRWTNGETKEIHPTTYNTNSLNETWKVNAADANSGKLNLTRTITANYNYVEASITLGDLSPGMRLDIFGDNSTSVNPSASITNQATIASNLIASHDINMIGPCPTRRLWSDQFGSLTTTGGITISWSKGNRFTLK